MYQENVIEFKGTKRGISIRIKHENDFEIIKQQLIEKLEKTQFFFKGAKISDIQCDTLTLEEKKELENLMSTRYKMHIEKKEDKLEPVLAKDRVFQGIAEGETKFVKGTLRSGQKVYYEGNVVILGDVNPGAEVTAYGNIIVMGNLRGVVHAGANGNQEACVAAFYLDPTQLRIADVITRAPDGDYEKPRTPELARIRGNMVCVEPYLMRK